MSHIQGLLVPAGHADLAVYRLRIQGKSLSLLFRTLSDQIRPNEDKLRLIEAGSGLAAVDVILTEDELTFVKLLHPDVQVNFLYRWDEETVRILNGQK